MKLIFCPHCKDIRNLKHHKVACECGKSYGYYLKNGIDAVIYGDAIPLGFANNSFISALRNRPNQGDGKVFAAFVIPRKCGTITRKPTSSRSPRGSSQSEQEAITKSQ